MKIKVKMNFILLVLILLNLSILLTNPNIVYSQAAALSPNISSKIDFGIEIFTPHLKIDEMNFENVKKMLTNDSNNIPIRAYVISKYINSITSGTKPIYDSISELEKLISFILLRYNPQISITCFDRAYLYMCIANLNYQNFNSKLYALMSLCDMAHLLTIEPLNPYYHLFFTVIYASLKDYEISEFKLFDPLEELKKALSFDVSDPQFHYIVGSTFLAIANNSSDIHQLAYAEFMYTIKLAPKNKLLKEKVFKNLLELLAYYDENKIKKPVWLEESAYLYLLEKNPNSAAIYNNLGYLYVLNNMKLDVALSYCKKAVSLDPNNPIFLHSLGCAYYKNRDIKKAIETLKKAYSLNPDLKEVHEHLSEIYLNLNDNESAILHLEYLLSQDSNNVLLNNNYAYILAEMNLKLDTALECIKKAIAAEPENVIYLDTLAWVYFKLKKVNEALETIDKAIKLDPTLGALYIHKGDILFYDNKINEALEYYSYGVLLEPNFPFALENYSLLSNIKFLQEKLKTMNITIPKVKDIICKNKDGKERIFSYDEYAYYLHHLFELLGFKHITFEEIKETSKKNQEKLKANLLGINGIKDENQNIENKSNNKSIEEKQKILDKNIIDSEILKIINQTGEIIFKDKTIEVIIDNQSKEVIINQNKTTSENILNNNINTIDQTTENKLK